jgi:HEAT repeat protein
VRHDAPSGDRPDRRAVARAGHVGDETTARAGAAHHDGRVRATALGALARLGVLTVEDLDAGLTDPDPAVRRRASTIAAGVRTNGGIEPAGLAARLLPLLDDPDASVAEAAAWSIGELPTGRGEAATRVRALARMAADHDDPLCREAAVAAIASLGHPDGLEPVLAALSDKPAIRRRAVVALAAFDDPRAEAALEAALEDRDRQVRETAEELLAVPTTEDPDDVA